MVRVSFRTPEYFTFNVATVDAGCYSYGVLGTRAHTRANVTLSKL